MSNETMADRLLMLRTEKGMTRMEVFKLTGISEQLLYKYETGRIVNIPIEKVELLATLYSSTPEYILGWGEEDERDREVTQIVEQLHKDKDLRLLLSKGRKLSKNDLNEVIRIINLINRE